MQLAKLRAEFKQIETVNPCSPRYQAMEKLIAGLKDEAKKQVAGANIKWLSYIAAKALGMSPAEAALATIYNTKPVELSDPAAFRSQRNADMGDAVRDSLKN